MRCTTWRAILARPSYLAANGARMAADAAADTGRAATAARVSLDRVARASVGVLEQGTGGGAVEVDSGLAEQTVKNLTFASVVLLQTKKQDRAVEDVEVGQCSLTR